MSPCFDGPDNVTLSGFDCVYFPREKNVITSCTWVRFLCEHVSFFNALTNIPQLKKYSPNLPIFTKELTRSL